MKSSNQFSKARHLRTFLLGSLICGGLVHFHATAQTTVQVDSTKNWVGYMNVYALAGGGQGGYQFGSGWGTGALTAFFTGTSTATLVPNTNTWNANDNYWVNTNTVPATGNKWMEANFYVDTGFTLAGQTVTFTGTVISNTLVSPYTAVAFIKEFGPGYSYIGMTTEPLSGGSSFTVTRAIGAGNICQYGFMTTGPNADPATMSSLGKAVMAVNNADPSLSALASHAAVEGQNVTFTVTAQGTAPLKYQWTQMTTAATNVLANGGRISGATSNSLTIANVTQSDAGLYQVTVTNTVGTNMAIARLTVVPFSQAVTNYLIDPGIEQGFAFDADSGWYSFNGALVANTNDFYFGSSTHVSVVDGTNAVQVYSIGPDSYNGMFQDRPATPGEVYTASCWFFTPLDDSIGGSNVCYLEVQFRDAAGGVLVQYSSDKITSATPTDTWIQLAPTNIMAGDFVTPLGTAPYMIAPAGTARVRTQVTYHAAVDPVVGGSVYVDALTLRLREPVVTASRSGGNIVLSFATHYGPSYRAYYKNNLTDPAWLPLGSAVTGDGTVKTISDPIGAGKRFYTVNTQ
jgi:hypothetical protein